MTSDINAEQVAPALARVRAAREEVERNAADLRTEVLQAREAGMSWARIAVALGVTRQSACVRYGVARTTDV